MLRSILFTLWIFPFIIGEVYLKTDKDGNVVLTNVPRLSPNEISDSGIKERKTTSPKTTSVPKTKPIKQNHNFDELILKYANKYRLDPVLIKAIMKVESNFNPRALSPKKAMGLMQITKGNIIDYKVNDPFDPEENLRAGAGFLQKMLSRFNNNYLLALAAYNAGPERVKQYNGIPPFKETQNYVKVVLRNYQEIGLLKGQDNPLFPMPEKFIAEGLGIKEDEVKKNKFRSQDDIDKLKSFGLDEDGEVNTDDSTFIDTSELPNITPHQIAQGKKRIRYRPYISFDANGIPYFMSVAVY
ncbi:MAG: lytic transglycosylase domain-containing protein [Candidatus Coatesbacteria bacterium]|nr:lytic transglycosylase domain-containing protein [Candidatus Coatesbacteria bacterium]